VFGCWTSASRKAVLPVFEKENGLLYYPTFYEGLEQSKNVIYTGQEATQQILAPDWVAKKKGQDLLPDRLRLHLAAHLEQDRAQAHRESAGQGGGRGVLPAGQHPVRSLINKIKLKKPDCIFAAVVGGSNVAFYKQLKAAGITPPSSSC
jgi:urea transport system substrate-binding protein